MPDVLLSEGTKFKDLTFGIAILTTDFYLPISGGNQSEKSHHE